MSIGLTEHKTNLSICGQVIVDHQSQKHQQQKSLLVLHMYFWLGYFLDTGGYRWVGSSDVDMGFRPNPYFCDILFFGHGGVAGSRQSRGVGQKNKQNQTKKRIRPIIDYLLVLAVSRFLCLVFVGIVGWHCLVGVCFCVPLDRSSYVRDHPHISNALDVGP